ncbi:MAG: divergent polysaccharide deacetylase family protein [Desulfobacterales bacterium]|jgi:uncharacterized protein|nr:divergent polysaccharide deacetylase family protein [Desulfobacteraceae bacterium]MBT4363242.1 divergent polysaccharide deacetylase family protein [Desulfobacteraceae bacterium]MBT7084830.1 divergent polysaccharide deacetylase family protein [Desulfobacterales bacterium]MBT7696916.1 divergent polysaccharide deacetylase family protein [Desulfobacterales bacterium]
MNRRSFLYKSLALITSGYTGLNLLPTAVAAENNEFIPNSEATISLIIDDIGYSLSRARLFIELDVPITFSILPKLSLTRDLSKEINDKGYEIMLHQPMEPRNSSIDPGPGALFMNFGSEQISEIVEENISEVPYATGVNNHMGSGYTEKQSKMVDALKVIRDKNLFFIDSRTTDRSVAYKTARQLHMYTSSRNVFLDNNPNLHYILTQLRILKAHAKKYGSGIAIGHPFPETAKAIEIFIKNPANADIKLVPISKILHG